MKRVRRANLIPGSDSIDMFAVLASARNLITMLLWGFWWKFTWLTDWLTNMSELYNYTSSLQLGVSTNQIWPVLHCRHSLATVLTVQCPNAGNWRAVLRPNPEALHWFATCGRSQSDALALLSQNRSRCSAVVHTAAHRCSLTSACWMASHLCVASVCCSMVAAYKCKTTA